MTRPAKQLDELVTITVPRSALTMVAAPPLTVTQRSCYEVFGISKEDYLRMVAKGAFPVKAEGQLRIALYTDVAAYMSAGTKREKIRTPAPPTKPKVDAEALLYKAGFRRMKRDR